MFSTILLALVLHVSGPSTDAPRCETVGPRLDGVTVEICDGRAVAYTDASGNTVRPADWR